MSFGDRSIGLPLGLVDVLLYGPLFHLRIIRSFLKCYLVEVLVVVWGPVDWFVLSFG